MTHPIYLVSKFHSNKKGVTIYFAQDSCKDIWSSEKMKAKIYTEEQVAENVAIKYKAFVSCIPILL